MVCFVNRDAPRVNTEAIHFNLYINDLFFTILTDICNFADDTTQYTIDMTLANLMVKLECAAKSALDWFHFNGMKLNFKKCHLLVCGHKFECMMCEIHDTQIIETRLVKLLGVTIESELTFKNYTETVCKKHLKNCMHYLDYVQLSLFRNEGC